MLPADVIRAVERNARDGHRSIIRGRGFHFLVTKAARAESGRIVFWLNGTQIGGAVPSLIESVSAGGIA